MLKILLVSHGFRPDIGGLEAMSELLATGFSDAGHQVCVLTKSNAADDTHDDQLPYGVVRNPGLKSTWRLVRGVDVVFHNNVCMRYAWPLLILRRPWVVATHTWLRRNSGRRGIIDVVKMKLLQAATLISASTALAQDMHHPSTVIPNAYDNSLFVTLPGVDRRPGTLVFVGRLAPGKGVHVLLSALREMRREGACPSLTIVGDGSERNRLEALALDYGLGNLVDFVGALQGRDLVETLNRHEVMVVPSLWNEPFGVVALEGAACGCRIVGTRAGGLPEAIGPCGSVVPNGDVEALADELRTVLAAPPANEQLRQSHELHLGAHTPERMVEGYLGVLEKARTRPTAGTTAGRVAGGAVR